MRTNPTSTLFTSLRPRAAIAAIAAAAALTACGGSDDGGGESGSAQFAQQCSLSNPFRADSDAGPNPASGSLTIEKQWVQAYVDEAYLWYDKVPSLSANAAQYSNESVFAESIDNYFFDLTNIPEDRFSFIYSTKLWNELSQSGVSLGYGITWIEVASNVWSIGFVEPASPADAAGLQRGDVLLAIDGANVSTVPRTNVTPVLFPSTTTPHSFTFTRGGLGTAPPVTLTPASVASVPVPQVSVIDTGASRVGYLLFNDHILTAEQPLANAVAAFRTEGISDLVIDLRYNGGGYLFLASQLAYMIAGDARTNGKTFERLQYNDKRTADNESANAVTAFFNVLCLPNANDNFNCTSTAALPALNLSRVYVLAGPGTCSASEAIVNGLRGVDVTVNIIGGTTCGKPYGFSAKDNCGISYFPIEFQGVNNKGFGDYAGGFAPTCAAADDLGRPLGDPSEGMLATALGHIATGSCTAGVTKPFAASSGRVLRGPERSNKFLLPGKGARLH